MKPQILAFFCFACFAVPSSAVADPAWIGLQDNGDIQVFKPDTTFVGTVDASGPNPIQVSPEAIAVVGNEIWVGSNSGTGFNVQRLAPDGTFHGSFLAGTGTAVSIAVVG